jgi:hypothetical protein
MYVDILKDWNNVGKTSTALKIRALDKIKTLN